MSFCRAKLDLFDFSSYVMLTDVNLVSDCAGPRMLEVRVSQKIPLLGILARVRSGVPGNTWLDCRV